MYDKGVGTTKDEAEAFQWIRLAAENGDTWAQLQIGWRHQYGIGTETNETEAVLWFQKAAKQGSDYAKKALKQLERK